MKKISYLTTMELLAMQRKYEFPKTLEEDAIQRGVNAELTAREDVSVDDLRKDAADGRAVSARAFGDLDRMREENNRLRMEIANLRKQVELPAA